MENKQIETMEGSRPLLSRSGCILKMKIYNTKTQEVLVPFYRGAVVFRTGLVKVSKRYLFSSPFIEERLYFMVRRKTSLPKLGSRPLLSRSGCISGVTRKAVFNNTRFSSPFIEERLYLKRQLTINFQTSSKFSSPFIEERLYFRQTKLFRRFRICSRPLLSRSGCI